MIIMNTPTNEDVMKTIAEVTDTSKFRILIINEKNINVKYDELRSKTDMKIIEHVRQALSKKFPKHVIGVNPQG